MDPIELAIKREFLQEARDLLEDLERNLLDLGRRGGEGGGALLDGIFRIMHTIKGSAMVAGFDGLGAFAHEVETVLALMRSRQLQWNKELGDLLLRATDRTRDIVAAVTTNFAAVVATEDLVDELRACCAANGESSPPPTTTPPPEGAGFGFFDDPVSPPPAAAALAGGATPEISSNGKAKVLICDDDSDLRELMSMFISQLGFECVLAASGREGLEQAARHSIDVILTDFKMPDMDGAAMAERLREKKHTAPIIFFSGFAQRADIVRFLHLGAYDFLEKPVEPTRLESVLLNALHLKRVRDASVRLSALTFKAFVTLSQAVDGARSGDAQAAQSGLTQAESLLDVIAQLTHYLVSPRVAEGPPKDGSR